MELSSRRLDTLPDSPGRRRDTLVAHERIDTRGQVRDLTLHKAALRESRSQESRVQHQQNPATLREDNSGHEQTDPQGDLEDRNKAHGQVVVLLDELSNAFGEGAVLVGGLAGWGRGRSGLLRRLERGDQVRARVGCDVEDGVNAEGEHGEGVLGKEEPDESHSCETTLISTGSVARMQWVTYRDTGHSHRQDSLGHRLARCYQPLRGHGTPCRPRCHTSPQPK